MKLLNCTMQIMEGLMTWPGPPYCSKWIIESQHP